MFSSARGMGVLVWLILIQTGIAATISFQDGVDGYAGTSDTWIGSAAPDNDNATSGVVEWDGEDGGGQNFGLLRFNDVFGSGANQVPAGAVINSAVLTYQVTNGGDSGTVNDVLVDWAPPNPVTWNNFGGDAGVQADEYGNTVGTAAGSAGTQTLDVTSSVAAWSANPVSNRGWIFRPTGTDGVEFVSSNSTTVSSRPELTVTFTLLTGVDIRPASIDAVVGQADTPVTVAIPPDSNATNPVNVTLTTDNAAVAVPVGASGGSLVVTFPAGGSNEQTVYIDIAQVGGATVASTNDAGLEDHAVAVAVTNGAVETSPPTLLVGTTVNVPVKVAITPGSNDTRAITVTLTSNDPAIVLPAGATGGALDVTFAQGAAHEQYVQVQGMGQGDSSLTVTNDSGLDGTTLPVSVFEGFNFTVTADPRTATAGFDDTLSAIVGHVTNVGAFHASPGDVDPLQPLRDLIDAHFGPMTLWYPMVGNHEAETSEDMSWIRSEYHTGNGVRTPLKSFTNEDGPTGSLETTYSWDYGNAHFISLNQYWDGGTTPGSDVATDGDVVQALYDWLAADLAATTKPVVFVFGHEPAFPFYRHIGDSLDQYPAHRDAFWTLLNNYGVHAYICGHTHAYSRYQTVTGGTWQVDVGNAGNDSSPGDGQTFANITVTSTEVRYDIYRNWTGTWLLSDTWTEPIGMRLHVEPQSFEASVRMGGALPDDTFEVSPVGDGTLDYTVTIDDSPTWLSAEPDAGATSGDPVPHHVSYSIADLAPGEYDAVIRVVDPAVSNSPQLVQVNVTITAVPGDFDVDGDVDQSDYGHFQMCLSGYLPQTDPVCADTLLDGDGDVDSDDMTIFLSCFGGPDQPIPPDCP